MAFQPPNEYDGYDPYDGYNRQGRGGRNHHHNHRNNYGGNRGRGRGRGRGARGYKGRPHYNKHFSNITSNKQRITSLERQLEQLRNEKDREIAQLRNRDGQRQEEMMQLNNENERITRENTELNEECKETKLELRRVKTELNQLKLDPANYLQWSDSEVVDWILSIQGGYRVYEERLRVSFAAENVNGRMLSQITKDDLRGWGITDFGDRSNIYFEIQNLLNQPNQNKNDEEGASTAFMGK
eukprot:91210_1